MFVGLDGLGDLINMYFDMYLLLLISGSGEEEEVGVGWIFCLLFPL